MIAAALALTAALSWGVGDFLGGLKSKTLPALSVLAVSQPIGFAALAIAVAIHWTAPPGLTVLWACLAAILGTTGLLAFYRGMAAGALSIVAPIAGAGAAIPVVWGLASGDRPSAVQDVGFVVAIAGVVLASRERRAENTQLAAGVGWAIVAMVAFGAYAIPMYTASREDFIWSSFVFRSTSLTFVALALLALRPRLPGRIDLPTLAAIGLLDTGGNVLFAAASSHGLVSVVSVLASLYPIVTVLLARRILHERVQRGQEAGVLLALVGVVLISAG
ncbi:MAG: EamA family transporter [Actinomycetota bacterium]|nr:EamA family transporter [Actinomycetota bacterium]